jgi:hypothetical protein
MKLRGKLKIDEATLRLVAAMYSNVSASVKNSSKCFHENVGVKQGDPLGPRLFNIYIDDLPDYLFANEVDSQDLDGVYLNYVLIRCLLYADDLVLSSLSPGGLQRQLDRLHLYCQKWDLVVNVLKTVCMFVKNNKCEGYSAPPISYNGTRLAYVDVFKYVGVLFSDDGSFRHQEEAVIDSSKNAMFACMSRAMRLSKNCPLYIKSLLFKAYVFPVISYCTEAILFSKKTEKVLDDIIVRYCRWALGVPKMTNSMRTVYECGLKPFRHIAAAARAKYFLLLQSRPSDHLTTHALLQLYSLKALNNAKPTSNPTPLSSAALIEGTASCLRKWGLFFADGLPSDPEYACFYIHHKKSLYNRVKQCSQNDWKNEVLGIGQVDPLSKKAIHRDVLVCLAERAQQNRRLQSSNIGEHGESTGESNKLGVPMSNSFRSICSTYGHIHNILNVSFFNDLVRLGSPTSTSHSLHLHSHSSVAAFGNVCLSERCSRSLALFRLRLAPVNRNFQYDAPVYDRLCSFCLQSTNERFIEDEYHVCFDCPLYESLRCKLLLNLVDSNFSFPRDWARFGNNCPPAPELLAALLSVKAPAHIRLVANFLFNCVALRSIYLTDCGLSSKATSFWLRFVARNELEHLNSLLCEAKSNNDCQSKVVDSFTKLLLHHFNVCQPSPVYLGVLVATAPCPLC